MCVCVCVCICPITATRRPVCLSFLFHTKMTPQFVHFGATLLKIFHLLPDKAQALLLAWTFSPAVPDCLSSTYPTGHSHPVTWLRTRLASHLPTLLGEAFEGPSHLLKATFDSCCFFLFVPSFLWLSMYHLKNFLAICFHFTFCVLTFCCSLKKSISREAGALM